MGQGLAGADQPRGHCGDVDRPWWWLGQGGFRETGNSWLDLGYLEHCEIVDGLAVDHR